MTGITIRPARLADAHGLAEVQVKSYRMAYAGLLPNTYLAQFSYAEQTEDWRSLLLSSPDPLLVAAQADGRVEGYALGRLASDGSGDGELVAIHVRAEQQQQGLGRRLLAELVDVLIAAGASSLMLETMAANPRRGWYERLGGELVGQRRKTIDDAGHEVEEVAYRWTDLAQLRAMLLPPDPVESGTG